MLMPIAPWTIPPDYLGAAERGAALGLQRSQIATGAQEAGDRLKLAYSQLAAENGRSAAALGSENARAAAALEEAKRRGDELQNWRMAQTAHQKAVEEQGQQRVDDARRRTNAKKIVHWNGNLWSFDPNSGESTPIAGAPQTDPVKNKAYNDLLIRRRQAEMSLRKSGLKPSEKTSIQAEIDKFNAQLQEMEKGGSGQPDPGDMLSGGTTVPQFAPVAPATRSLNPFGGMDEPSPFTLPTPTTGAEPSFSMPDSGATAVPKYVRDSSGTLVLAPASQ